MILMEMMLEVAMGVMDMEDDKVAVMVLRIPNEEFTDGTVVMVLKVNEDDVRGNDVFAGQWTWMLTKGAQPGD